MRHIDEHDNNNHDDKQDVEHTSKLGNIAFIGGPSDQSDECSHVAKVEINPDPEVILKRRVNKLFLRALAKDFDSIDVKVLTDEIKIRCNVDKKLTLEELLDCYESLSDDEKNEVINLCGRNEKKESKDTSFDLFAKNKDKLFKQIEANDSIPSSFVDWQPWNRTKHGKLKRRHY